MRRSLSVLLPLSLGLVLGAISCNPDEPGPGPGDDAGIEEPLPDAGTDAGSDPEPDAGTDAGSDAGTEEPGPPCTSTSPQPAECAYGSYCGASGTCQSVPTATCDNFSKYPVEWEPATSTGPVIYSAELISFATDETNCPPTLPLRIRTRIRAYSPAASFPTTASELASVFSYYRANGSSISDASLFGNIVTSDDRKNIEFELRTCVAANTTTVDLGFNFDGGNAFCQQASR